MCLQLAKSGVINILNNVFILIEKLIKCRINNKQSTLYIIKAYKLSII